MLTQLPEHFQPQFATSWEHLLQQKRSRLDGKTRAVPVNGKERTFSQLGTSQMREVTTRNGVTLPSDTAMVKRWLRIKAYDEVTFIDEFDDISLGDLPTPKSEHVQSHAMAAFRTMDSVLIAAMEGTNYTGEDGTTAVTLGAGQQVAVNYVRSGSPTNSGLTLAKILRALSILRENEVEDEDPLYLVVSQRQIDDLLNDVVEVKSVDYNNVKALVDGTVNKFGGFEFVRTQLLTLNASTDVRTCIAFAKSGVVLGVGRERGARVDIRPDLNHTIQIRTTMALGATRLQEEKVVLVYCDESP
jgi:hypothetical protein